MKITFQSRAKWPKSVFEAGNGMVEWKRRMLMVLSRIPGHPPGMVAQDQGYQVYFTPKVCPGGKMSPAHPGSCSFRLHTKLTDLSQAHLVPGNVVQL